MNDNVNYICENCGEGERLIGAFCDTCDCELCSKCAIYDDYFAWYCIDCYRKMQIEVVDNELVCVN